MRADVELQLAALRVLAEIDRDFGETLTDDAVILLRAYVSGYVLNLGRSHFDVVKEWLDQRAAA